MTDLVERLRTHEGWPVDAHHDALEAADEIARLREAKERWKIEVERLRERSMKVSGIERRLDMIHEELETIHERIRKAGM